MLLESWLSAAMALVYTVGMEEYFSGPNTSDWLAYFQACAQLQFSSIEHERFQMLSAHLQTRSDKKSTDGPIGKVFLVLGSRFTTLKCNLALEVRWCKA